MERNITMEDMALPILEEIEAVVQRRKALEAREKELKDKLKGIMEEGEIKAFDTDQVRVTYIAATTSTTIDSAKLKKKYPTIAEECSKTSTKSAYVKVEVKE